MAVFEDDLLLGEVEAHAASRLLLREPGEADLAQQHHRLGRGAGGKRGLDGRVVELRPAAHDRALDDGVADLGP